MPRCSIIGILHVCTRYPMYLPLVFVLIVAIDGLWRCYLNVPVLTFRNSFQCTTFAHSFVSASPSSSVCVFPIAMADAPQTVELKVAMSCQGCVGAVKRVLGKMEGVETYDIDLKEQKVTVKGKVKPEDVLNTVSKTGKATTFWPKEGAAAV